MEQFLAAIERHQGAVMGIAVFVIFVMLIMFDSNTVPGLVINVSLNRRRKAEPTPTEDKQSGEGEGEGEDAAIS